MKDSKIEISIEDIDSKKYNISHTIAKKIYEEMKLIYDDESETSAYGKITIIKSKSENK